MKIELTSCLLNDLGLPGEVRVAPGRSGRADDHGHAMRPRVFQHQPVRGPPPRGKTGAEQWPVRSGPRR